MNINELQTGDIVLVTNNETGIFNWFLNMIKYSTHSDYVHIGMIIKDPEFITPPLKGTYLWESSYEGTPDPQDNTIKLGVQLTEISTIINNYKNAKFYIRRLKDTSMFTTSLFKRIHKIVYDIPYDTNPLDWIFAFFRIDLTPQKVDRFWCSAFVGYILTESEVLSPKTDWSILYPCDFALDGENLNYKDKHNTLIPTQSTLIINNTNDINDINDNKVHKDKYETKL